MPTGNRIQINNKDYSKEVSNLDTIEYIYGLDRSSKSVNIKTSTSLEFTGSAADLLIEQFYKNPCAGKDNILKVRVYDCDCGIWREFQIDKESIGDYCITENGCTISAELSVYDDDLRCTEVLKDTIIFENGFAGQADFIKVPYCSQPNFFGFILFYLRKFAVIIIVFSIAFSGVPIVGFLGLALSIAMIAFKKQIDDYIHGCGDFNLTVLLKDIIEYHCDACGLKFQSSILQSGQYKNSTLFSLIMESGRKSFNGGQDVKADFFSNNQPALTVVQLLDKIIKLFNAEWRVDNGILYLERRDYFIKNRQVLFNLTDYISKGKVSEICINHIKQSNKNFARYEYQQDSLDREGNRMLSKFNTIYDLNPERLETRKGERTNIVDFGAVRFMFDQHTYIKKGFQLQLDNFRKSKGFDGLILLTNDSCSFPKILLLEDDFDPENAKVIKRQLTTERFIDDNIQLDLEFDDIDASDGQYFDYNYPYIFNQDYPVKELIQNFFYIERTGNGTLPTLQVSQIAIAKDCDMALKIDKSINYKLASKWGDVIIGEFKISKDEMEFSGSEIYC